MKRTIFTIDLDAFFASCEEVLNPNLKNFPIVIGYELNQRGVVSTANYKARKFGIHSGMPIYKAKKLCPDVKVVDPNFEYYVEMSEKVFEIIGKYSKKISINSIDECQIDISEYLHKNKETPLNLAIKIQKEILLSTKLGVSIGISNNKPLSKIASKLKKPMGIETLYKSEIEQKLWPLNVESLYSLGSATQKVFNEEGIFKIGQIANLNPNLDLYVRLESKLGTRLDYYISSSRGEGDDKINEKSDVVLKSLGHAETFIYDLVSFEEIEQKAFELTNIVVKRLQYRKLICNVVILSYPGSNSKAFNKTIRLTMKEYTSNLEIIWANLLKLLEKWFTQKPTRYLGVYLSGFKDSFYYNEKQLTLEDIDRNILNLSNSLEDKNKRVKNDNLIKNINFTLGYEAITNAQSLLDTKKWIDKGYNKSDGIKFKGWGSGPDNTNKLIKK